MLAYNVCMIWISHHCSVAVTFVLNQIKNCPFHFYWFSLNLVKYPMLRSSCICLQMCLKVSHQRLNHCELKAFASVTFFLGNYQNISFIIAFNSILFLCWTKRIETIFNWLGGLLIVRLKGFLTWAIYQQGQY